MPPNTPEVATARSAAEVQERTFREALSPKLEEYIELSTHREFALRNPPVHEQDRPSWEEKNTAMQSEARALRRELGCFVAEYLHHKRAGDPVEDEAFTCCALETFFKEQLRQTAEDHARAVMKYARGKILGRLRETGRNVSEHLEQDQEEPAPDSSPVVAEAATETRGEYRDALGSGSANKI